MINSTFVRPHLSQLGNTSVGFKANPKPNTVVQRQQPQVKFGYEGGLLAGRIAIGIVGLIMAIGGWVGMAGNKAVDQELAAHNVITSSQELDQAIKDNQINNFSEAHKAKAQQIEQELMNALEQYDSNPSEYWDFIATHAPEILSDPAKTQQASELMADASNIEDINDFRNYAEKWINYSNLSEEQKTALKQEVFDFSTKAEKLHEGRESKQNGQIWLLAIGLLFLTGDMFFLFLPDILDAGLDW